MQITLSTLLASLSLAAAAPTILERELLNEESAREIVAMINSTDLDFEGLLGRATPSDFRDMVPGCDLDPSFVIPKNTEYSIDQGVKIPKQGKDDLCTTGHNDDHCWTEYYLVESAIEYSGWENTGASIDCATTKECSSQVADLGETCTAHTKSKSYGYDGKIIEIAFEYAIPSSDKKLMFSTAHSYTFQHTDEDTTTTCTSTSTTNICTWEDKKCHQVWYAQRNKRIWGHAQRVCNGDTINNGIQQHTKRGNGQWVRGQAGFNFLMPINKLVGCSALCADQTYNEPKPADEARKPLEVPAWQS